MMTQQATVCTRCRRMIGSDETHCSWCGARRPGNGWKATWRGGMSGDWWIRAVIAANIAFYFLSLVLGTDRGLSGNPLRILSPQDSSLLLLGATGTIPISEFGRPWTLLTANYLHGGLLHIFFNLLAFRQIAPWVAQEYGSNRMFVIYTVGGICGYLVSYVAGVAFTVGASAAICALIGSLLYYGRSRGGAYGAMVYREVSGWVIGLILFGLVMPGINNWGHGGGIIGGIILGKLLGYEERRPEGWTDRYLASAWGAITLLALGWGILSAMGGLH